MSHMLFVVTKFLEHLKPTLSVRNRLKLESKSVTPEKTFNTFLAKLPHAEHGAVYQQLGATLAEYINNAQTNQELYDALLEKVIEVNKPVKRNTDAMHFNSSIKCPLSELRLVVNVLNRTKSVLYDPKNDQVFPYDYQYVCEVLKEKVGKEFYWSWAQDHEDHCEFTYNPTIPGKGRVTTDAKGHEIFNLWSEASWRVGWVPDPTATLPAEVDEYLDLLVEAEDRPHMLAWLRDCTFDKAEPILVMCGVPGVGKNIWVINVAAGLVGAHNRRGATVGFKDSSFHSSVASCRLFFLDEAELDPKSREILKAYHNGTAAIERKGEDVGDPEPLYASFVLANNDKHKIKLQYTDRKFYTPRLRTKPLNKTWAISKIDEFVELLTQDDYLRQIASYLKFNVTAGTSRDFPKNSFFEEVCMNTAPGFFKKFYHQCKHKKRFTSAEFNRGSTIKLDPHIIKDAVDQYSAERGKPLADIEILEDYSWIATSKIYDANNATSGDVDITK